MKGFLKTFFAVCLANLLFIAVGLFVFFVVVVAFLFSAVQGELSPPIDITDNSILKIDLYQPIAENSNNAASVFDVLSDKDANPSLIEVEALIERASKDDNIEGILLIAGDGLGGGSPSRIVAERLSVALRKFKQSSKPIFAYGDNFSEFGYLISSEANKIYMHPEGRFEWDGICARMTFYSKLMKKTGIEMQIFYAGNFKSATEPFRNEKMSSYNKEQLTELINVFYDNTLSVVSDNRKISKQLLKQYANNLEITMAHHALANKLVDELQTYQATQEKIKQKIAGKEELNYVSLSEYRKQFSKSDLLNTSQNKDADGDSQIALVYLEGAVVNENTLSPFRDEQYIVASKVVELLEKLGNDKHIKSVVLRINSPGGSAHASETIYQAINQLKKKKPVVVSMADLAASGGYYIACAGDSVFGSKLTITGSIGVFAMIPSAEKFLKDEMHLTYDQVATSPHAIPKSASFFAQRLDEVQRKKLQEGVDHTYETFIHRVAQSRKLEKNKVREIAQGRVWTGEPALKYQLIDALGGTSDALRAAAHLARIASFEVVVYPEPQSWFEKKLASLQREVYTYIGLKGLFQSDLYQRWKELKQIEQQQYEMQTRLPFTVQID